LGNNKISAPQEHLITGNPALPFGFFLETLTSNQLQPSQRAFHVP